MAENKSGPGKGGRRASKSAKRPQLATRTFLLLILTGLLPSLVAALVNVRTQQALLSKHSQNLEVSAKHLAQSFSSRLEEASAELAPMVRSGALGNPRGSLHDRMAEMHRLKGSCEIFDELLLIDSEGEVLASTGPRPELSAKQKEWLRQMGKSSVKFYGPVSLREEGPEGLVGLVGLPSVAREATQMLMGFASFATLTVDIDPFTLGQSGFALLASPDGKILAGSSPSLVGRTIPKGPGNTDGGADGGGLVGFAGDYFTAKSTLAPSGLASEAPWQVVVGQSRAEIMESTRQSAMWSLLTVVLITPAVLALGLLFSSSMRRSLGALVSAARAVAEGDLKPLPANKSYREIGELADAFDQMTESLSRSREDVRQYQQHLENLVEQRTKELQGKSEQLEASNSELQAQASRLEQARGEAVKAHEELKTAQGEIIQMEKMSSLGQLVAGIAHEMNTPIGAIYNCLDQMHRRLSELPGFWGLIRSTSEEELESLSHLANRALEAPTGADVLLRQGKRNELMEKMQQMGLSKNTRQIADMLGRFGLTEKEDLEAVSRLAERFDILSLIRSFGDLCQSSKITKQSAEKVANIIQALRYYSHSDKDSVAAIDLNESLSTTLVIMQNKIKSLAKVEIKIADKLPVVYANGELSQVWTNLINNALDAIEEKGLGAETGRLVITAEQSEPDCVAVNIGGNGKAIPSEARSRVFDPFFTTKGIGKGSGLGLSVVRGIVQRHHGEVSFCSNDDWTSFTVTLPVGEPKERHGVENKILCDVR